MVLFQLVGGLEHFSFFHSLGNNNPNWLIFFKGVETTNQSVSWNIRKFAQIYYIFIYCFYSTVYIYIIYIIYIYREIIIVVRVFSMSLSWSPEGVKCQSHGQDLQIDCLSTTLSSLHSLQIHPKIRKILSHSKNPWPQCFGRVPHPLKEWILRWAMELVN